MYTIMNWEYYGETTNTFAEANKWYVSHEYETVYNETTGKRKLYNMKWKNISEMVVGDYWYTYGMNQKDSRGCYREESAHQFCQVTNAYYNRTMKMGYRAYKPTRKSREAMRNKVIW